MSDLPHNFQTDTLAKIFPVDALTVRLYDRADELTTDAAKITQRYLQNLLTQQETARVILATGNSQIEFLSKLVNLGEIDWSRIVFFHLDEYLGIDANHPASFRRYLRERVEEKVHPAAFHYIDGDTVQPLAECDRYTKLLLSQPIDLCCLGMGGNGHLAFNEPSVADFQDPDYIKLVKLELSTRQQQVNQGYFNNIAAVPQYAFTLTIPAICLAQKIFCFALGKHKAQAVQQTLEGAIATSCPATILRSQAQATLFLDADSASLLGKSKVKS
ncbi:glucosamine-6-phosphate deaminase [Chroococcidiopsis sp. CCALA 051]|uniref:glucosamine-6-phosphate deaminase n=1 Tax=Chroococcidiopsis sp. CCALA 051 TaxID=869949 RepID=UPI000D0D4B68|nr:glucosamine-6-phosphate deaminase [Chroococcidiopsis sp. CCALA 051]PSM50601.1 glucosamine-6-phosphate deaminase [Chroococcidiopsis sp. CCALA 051]